MTGIVFTKTALSQEAIGNYETFLFLAGAVSFFWLNGLLKALLPLHAAKKDASAVLFSAFAVISVFSLLVALVLFFARPVFSTYLLSGKAIPSPELLLVYLVFGIPANMTAWFYLVKKKIKALMVYGLVSFFFQFVLIVLPAIMGKPVYFSLLGLVISSLLRYGWLWGIFIYYREVQFSASFVTTYLKMGTPLIAATFLSGSAQFVDGFIVTSRFDEATFAVFRYGARELPLVMLLANALSNAMLSEFAQRERLKENLLKLKGSVNRLMHWLFPLTALLLILAHPLFPVLFNPRFEASATIFNIYLLLIISRLLMPQTILNGLGHTREIVLASFFELVLNISLSLLLVQFFGISGIAFATVLAYLFEKVFLMLAVRRKLGISLSQYHPVKYFLLYSAGILVIFIFAETIF